MKTIIIDGIEYNLTPKVLFKKGDFVVIQETTYQITKVENLNVTLSLNGRECIFDIDVLKNAHLWTIQDAKEGDVLACENGWTCIFKCLNDNTFSSHCFMDNEGWFCEDGGQAHTLDNGICGEIHPATKEQHDLLFAKMQEAGYEWNEEKKELRKMEQKPKWTEEDDAIVHCCIGKAERDIANGYVGRNKELIDWLKSLKQRMEK